MQSVAKNSVVTLFRFGKIMNSCVYKEKKNPALICVMLNLAFGHLLEIPIYSKPHT